MYVYGKKSLIVMINLFYKLYHYDELQIKIE